MSGAPVLELYYDLVCPYAYLAHREVEALARECGAELVLKPILLGGVFRALGAPDSPAFSAPRAAHGAIDLQRWARRRGATLRFPEGHPRRTVLALRAALASGDLGKATRALFAAYWERGADLEDPAVVAEALTAAGLDGAAAVGRADGEEARAELRRRTDEAVAQGIFGVPTFAVRSREGHQLFWGQDRLDFVRQALLGRWPEKPAHAPLPRDQVLPFYFDFSSPFAYLASTQVEAVASRAGATVAYRPILLGALFRQVGTPMVPLFAMPPAKQAYVALELSRWAERWGVPFRQSSRFPVNTVRPLRVVLAAPVDERPALIHALFRAVWADDLDVNDDAVLRDIIVSAACDPEPLLEAATSDAVKAALRTSTAEAEARGVFGVPTFVVDGELYWGQDRLDLVEEALARPHGSPT